MAAKKPSTPVTPPPELPTVPEAPAEAVSYIDIRDLLTTVPAKTRLDVELLEQVRAILAAQRSAIADYIRVQVAKGLTEQEVMECCAIELPLRMTVIQRNGRQVVEYPFRIVGDEDA